MRILILTHPRSGGMSLMKWIENELEYSQYHEPFFGNGDGLSDDDIKTKLLIDENIVVKDFPFRIKERKYDLYDVISKFDKIIIHRRGSQRDVAISLVYFQLNDGSKIHLPYEITDEWIEENENNINQMMSDIKNMFDDIENLSIENCLYTTYDGIYNDETDIPKLLDFLKIKEPLYLDILNKRHRLQNGTIGMGDVIVKIKESSNLDIINEKHTSQNETIEMDNVIVKRKLI